MSTACVAPGDATCWGALIQRIRTGDSSACEELYATAFVDVRRWFRRRLGAQYAEDPTHDTYVATIRAIINGGPREPESLPGFIQSIAHRQFCVSVRVLLERRGREVAVDRLNVFDPAQDPNSAIFDREKRDCVKRALGSLSAEQRDILVRFYIREQSAEDICTEMGLTPTQFRLLKWRAKAEFTALAQKHLRRQALRQLAKRSAQQPSPGSAPQ